MTDTELKNVFDQALSNHQAFFVDWKSPLEDIVFNLKTLLPDLPIKSLPEKQVLGDWTENMVLNNQEFSFKTDSPTFILEIIKTINQYLSQQNQTLVWYDTQDDLYCFLLIDLKDKQNYLDKGFKLI